MDQLGAHVITHQFQSLVDTVIRCGTEFSAFIVIAALVMAFAFYFGHDRLLPLIAALFMAITLSKAFPFSSMLPVNPYTQVGLYAGFVVIGLIAFSGLSYFMASGSIGFVKTGILSVLTAGLIIAIAIHFLSIENIYAFSAPTKALFASNQAFFWWLIAPLAGLFFLGR